MRPTPIPDAEVWEGAHRHVIAPPSGDLTDTDISAVEALIDTVQVGDGATRRYSMRCMPEGNEAQRIAAGAPVWVEFLGAQLHPFLVVVGSTPPKPQVRVEVDFATPTGVPVFQTYVDGVDQDKVGVFVDGVIEALQRMRDGGLGD